MKEMRLLYSRKLLFYVPEACQSLKKQNPFTFNSTKYNSEVLRIKITNQKYRLILLWIFKYTNYVINCTGSSNRWTNTFKIWIHLQDFGFNPNVMVYDKSISSVNSKGQQQWIRLSLSCIFLLTLLHILTTCIIYVQL